MNIGNFIGSILPFDPTPGYNLSRGHEGSGVPVYGAATGTTHPLGVGSNPAGTTRNTANTASHPLNQTTAPYGGSGYVQGRSTTASNATGPAYDPAQLAQYDQAIGIINSSLGRIPGQLGIARANIADQFRVNQNELNSAKDQAQNTFDTQNTQNQQNYRTDKNTIADESSSGLRGLLRILGAYGAGGSSDARYVAPQAVASEASVQRAGAGQNFAQNAQALDTNFNNFLTEDKQERQKLTDWRALQERQAESQVNNTKQDLLAKLADLTGKRTAYMGGSYTGGAQPFIDQSNALAKSTDALARFSPSYTGETPTYEAPTLDSFIEDPATTGVEHSALTDTTSPYLAMLLGQRDRRNNGLF